MTKPNLCCHWGVCAVPLPAEVRLPDAGKELRKNGKKNGFPECADLC